jgi:hypothetical protein
MRWMSRVGAALAATALALGVLAAGASETAGAVTFTTPGPQTPFTVPNGVCGSVITGFGEAGPRRG